MRQIDIFEYGVRCKVRLKERISHYRLKEPRLCTEVASVENGSSRTLDKVPDCGTLVLLKMNGYTMPHMTAPGQ